MKALLLFVLILSAGSIQAEPVARVLRVDGHESSAPLHVWGGKPVPLAIEIETPGPDRKLNLRADVFQIAGAIAAPLDRNLPVARDLSFGQSTARVEKWNLPLPAVTRISLVLVRFAAQSGEGADWHPAGEMRFVVYPADFSGQIKDFIAAAQEHGGGQLGVFGESPKIKAAFRSLSIPFTESGESLPSELEAGTIYLGECGSRELETLASRELRGRVLFFVDDPALLPGVYWTDHSGGGYQAKVALPLFTDLASEPQRLATFFHLLQRIYPSPSTKP